MRVTIDLMKKSTQIIDLSNVINPRVGDDDLLLPLHIVYDDNQTDMRGKDVEFLSNDTNKKRIYVAGTCNTNTPGDNLLMGNLTFRFPAGTFKADGTYDPDKTMFRIVDKETKKVISSVNVKITVMKNNIEFDFDPDKSSYDSRLETMLQDFHDKGQAMLDEIKDLNNQANSNVSGDTATTAKEAKKQADQNAGDISDLKGEVAGARGRFADMAGREDAQDIAINQKESIANANANYAALQQKNAKLEGRQTALSLEYQSKLAQINVNPEFATDINELTAKYPNGKEGVFILNNGHTAIYQNGWQDSGHSITVGSFQFKAFVDVNSVQAPYDSLDTLPANSVVFYAPDVTEKFLASPTNSSRKAIIVITLGADASYTQNYSHVQEVIDRDSGIKYLRSSWIGWNGTGDWYPWHSNDFEAAVQHGTQNLFFDQTISQWTSHISGAAVISDDPNVQFANTPIMHIEETKAEGQNNFVSAPVEVSQGVISVQLPEMIVGEAYPDSHVYFTIFPLADGEAVGDDAVNQKAISFPLGNTVMKLGKFENIKLPANTKQIALGVSQNGIGHLFFGIPAVNYGPKCIAYSPSSIADDLDKLSKEMGDRYNELLALDQDIFAGSKITKWAQSIKGKIQVETDNRFHTTPIMHMTGTESGQWNHLVSEEVPVTQNIISVQLPEMIANEVYGSSNVYLSIVPLADGENYGDQSTISKIINLGLSNSTIGLHSYPNLNLPVGTKKIVIDVIQYGIGDVYVGKPVVNYGPICISYDQLETVEKLDSTLQKAKEASANLLYGMRITDFNNLVKGKVEIATDADKQFAGTTIMHITGTAAGQWNNWRSDLIPVTGDTISIQLPEMDENWVYGSSKEYMQIYALADGESISSSSAQEKSQMFALSNSTMKLGKFENVKLPADTKNLVIDFIQYGLGDLYFGMPTINYGSQCIPYNQITLSQSLADALNNAGSGVNTGGSGFDIPEMHISADSGSYGYSKKPVAFKFLANGNTITGYLNFDIQGDSSRSYPKTNFKIKLYTDAEGKNKLKVKMHSSWSKSSNYNLKANWIDATHARNIVNARLIKDAVSVTPLENPGQTKKILSTEGLGQIDGFPIELYFNDGYHGLYTLNTKKDEATFGMDSKDATNEVLSTELGKKDITDSTKAIIDGKNWSTEIHDVASDNVKSNLVKFLNFIEQSNDVDFRANLKNYIDVSSVINLILFGWLSQEYDFYSKSELFATWNDGGYWYLIPYDLDSTWGLLWDGSDVVPNRDDFDLSKIFSDPQTAWAASANDNKFQQRVIKLFKPEIKKQGQLLRSTVWSTPNIIASFKAFIDEVPTFAYQRDQEKWTTIPSIKTTDFKQIQSAVIQRGQEFDDFLNKI